MKLKEILEKGNEIRENCIKILEKINAKKIEFYDFPLNVGANCDCSECKGKWKTSNTILTFHNDLIFTSELYYFSKLVWKRGGYEKKEKKLILGKNKITYKNFHIIKTNLGCENDEKEITIKDNKININVKGILEEYYSKEELEKIVIEELYYLLLEIRNTFKSGIKAYVFPYFEYNFQF